MDITIKTGQRTEASERGRAKSGGITSRMGRRRKRGSEQTGLGAVGKIRVRLVAARTRSRGSGEQAHNMVVLSHVLNL
jgi:hypothetical protein